MKSFKLHDITLENRPILLRPLTEGDWQLLTKWNSDPEILYWTEGDNVAHYDLDQVQYIYRSVSQTAYCFIVELNKAPIGECWLQGMNLERILTQFPHLDCRRIDLMIGEKAFWGQGVGTKVIRLLTEFGLEREKAHAIFGCDIADYNLRSLKAFQHVGFEVHSAVPQPSADKARYRYDLILSRQQWNHPSKRIA